MMQFSGLTIRVSALFKSKNCKKNFHKKNFLEKNLDTFPFQLNWSGQVGKWRFFAFLLNSRIKQNFTFKAKIDCSRSCRNGLLDSFPLKSLLLMLKVWKITNHFSWHDYSVADPDPGSGIGCLFDPWIRDGRKSASGSGIRDEQPGSYFLELRNHFFSFFGV